MRSISRRLAATLVPLLLCSVLLIVQGSVWLYDRAQRNYLTLLLQRETDSLLAALTVGPDGLYLDLDKVDPDYARPYSGRYFVVQGREKWRSRSLWDHRLPLPGDGLQSGLLAGPQGQELLVWSGDYRKAGELVTISVALDYRPLLSEFRLASWWISALAVLVVLLAVLVQQWLLRRSLLPLRRLQQELAEWRSGERLQLSEQVPDELQPLAVEINRLGRQIEELLQRARNSAGDLGHALKTPLAVVESRLDSLAGQLSAADYRELQGQLQSMRNQLERSLQRARLAPDQARGARFDPGADLPALVQTLASLYPKAPKITLNGRSDSAWPFDREDMLELLGNLLDNACKWAASQIRLSWLLDADQLQLEVADDGPGIAPTERARVLGRGTRLDQQAPGHGLGLAIVGDLVAAYGGKLALQQAPEGGLLVLVSLPRERR
ncbi:sensor histidine kinase [Halopseudomonas sp.]|uniref:sensor histidine kinase n=1 Tax=Halopseudomonas sp. TaxID=2901191 RepID=UPI00311EE4DD